MKAARNIPFSDGRLPPVTGKCALSLSLLVLLVGLTGILTFWPASSQAEQVLASATGDAEILDSSGLSPSPEQDVVPEATPDIPTSMTHATLSVKDLPAGMTGLEPDPGNIAPTNPDMYPESNTNDPDDHAAQSTDRANVPGEIPPTSAAVSNDKAPGPHTGPASNTLTNAEMALKPATDSMSDADRKSSSVANQKDIDPEILKSWSEKLEVLERENIALRDRLQNQEPDKMADIKVDVVTQIHENVLRERVAELEKQLDKLHMQQEPANSGDMKPEDVAKAVKGAIPPPPPSSAGKIDPAP